MVKKYYEYLDEKWSSGPKSGKHFDVEVSVNGFDFLVDGYYEEGEDEIRYLPGGGYPGANSRFNISKIKTYDSGGDIIDISNDLLVDEYDITTYELEEEVIDEIEKDYRL